MGDLEKLKDPGLSEQTAVMSLQTDPRIFPNCKMEDEDKYGNVVWVLKAMKTPSALAFYFCIACPDSTS